VTPTAKYIGARIKEAIDTADFPEGSKHLELVAGTLGTSKETLERYINGVTDPSALFIWQLAELTGRSFGWFAGDLVDVPEELDRAILTRLLRELELRDATVAKLRGKLEKADPLLVSSSDGPGKR
jgi:transcriptional regulator with XRE-family HTH domain